jgi:hypothetical protein
MSDTSPIALRELKDRIGAIMVEALANLPTPVQAVSFPRWYVKSSEFPYLIHRSAPITSVFGADDYGDEIATYAYTVTSRLIYAHITAGYEGEVDEAIDDAIPQIIQYLDARELLQCADFPDAMQYIREANFQACSGFQEFPLSVAGTIQAGAEFLWRVEFDVDQVQAFT